jgi:hypothetical protein
VGTKVQIDVSFDFRNDTPGYPKSDPDVRSPTLRRYHKFLWSKPLPSGAEFTLVDTTRGVYLHHSSSLGEFCLASDAVIPTFRREVRLSHIFEQIPEELAEFVRIGYTIGGMMLFPGVRVGRQMTINGARGFHPRVKDRFDLTIECIRRHYRSEPSPLQAVLGRYSSFFDLFGDFRGYVEFFLLQDLVANDCSTVKFFAPFTDFTSSPLPEDLPAYRAYQHSAVGFIEARNRRILDYCNRLSLCAG